MSAALTEAGTSRTSQLGDLKLHYHEAGKGEALVLLHGGGPGAAGWTNFHRNIGAFAERYRVLVPDLPGFGESSKPVYEEQIGGFNARVLRDWLDALGVSRAHFIGNSMGGHVAMKFAVDYPERAGKLVLMAPALQIAMLAPNPTEGAKILRGYYFGAGPSLERMKQFLGSLVYAPDRVDEATLKERFERSVRADVAEWSKKMPPAPHRFEPLWKDLGSLKQPVLLVWGRDDRVVPLDRGLFMVHQLPDVRLHVFGNCGHWAMLEHPEAFNRVCLDFLAD